MADRYKSYTKDLTTNGEVNVYSVPTTDAGAVPPVHPTTAIIKSIRICNDSGSSSTITLQMLDASNSNFEASICNVQAVAANTAVEILQYGPIVANEGDIVKATAADANRLHVILSVLEISQT